MASRIANTAAPPIPLTTLPSQQQTSNAGPPSAMSQQPSVPSPPSHSSQQSSTAAPRSPSQQPLRPSPSTSQQLSSNAVTRFSPSQQPSRPAPSPPPQPSNNLGVPGSQNPQLLSPPSANLSGSISSNASGSSSTINTINIPKSASSPILPTSNNPTHPANAASASPAVPRYAFIQNTLRAWGLGSVYALGSKIGQKIPKRKSRSFKKRPHITLFKHRGVALWASLLHLLPVAGTAVITYYINTDYFLGKELPGQIGADKFKVLGLQFAAKVHELLMISTLANVIFAMVRHELSRGDGLPLAGLAAGLSVSKVSYLWSKDFIALCRAKYDTVAKKILFIAAILTCIILSLAVAPASATALMAIKREWAAGGTKIWLNNTKDQLFPDVLNDTHTLGPICNVSGGHSECPSARWQAISEGYLPHLHYLNSYMHNETDSVHGALMNLRRWDEEEGSQAVGYTDFGVLGRHSVSKFNIETRHSLTTTEGVRAYYYRSTWSIATAPHISVADALRSNFNLWSLATNLEMEPGPQRHRFKYRSSSSYKATVPAPIVWSKCVQGGDYFYHLPWDPYKSSHKIPLFIDYTKTNNGKNVSFSSGIINQTDLWDWSLWIDGRFHVDEEKNARRPELLWFDLPPEWSNKASIGVAISLPAERNEQLWGCIVDARWWNDTLTGIPKHTAWADPSENWSDWLSWDDKNYSRVYIRPSFAQYLNPHLPASNSTATSNSTVFEEMLIASGLYSRETYRLDRGISDGTDSGFNSTHVHNTAGQIETILNLMVVNGMARTAPYTLNYGTIEDLGNPRSPWWRAFMPQGGAFGPGGDPYTLTEEQKENSFSFQLDMFAEGYGYSFSNSTASRVSIAILLVQLAIAVSFIIYSILTGTSSSSWDSPAELISLALASKEPADPKGLATGEASIKSLSKLYCVEADGKRLQLKEFAAKVPEGNRVKPNTVYE